MKIARLDVTNRLGDPGPVGGRQRRGADVQDDGSGSQPVAEEQRAEVTIVRDEKPFFGNRRLKHDTVRRATHPLSNGNDVMARGAQEALDGQRDALVAEYPHGALRSERKKLFGLERAPCQRENRLQGLGCELGIVLEDVALEPALFEQAQDEIDGQTCSFHSHGTSERLGITLQKSA